MSETRSWHKWDKCCWDECQAGKVILDKAPKVCRQWDIDHQLVECCYESADMIFHPGCWAAYNNE